MRCPLHLSRMIHDKYFNYLTLSITLCIQYWKTSNMSAAPPWWVHNLWVFLFNTVPIHTTVLLVLLPQRLRSPKLGVNSQPTSGYWLHTSLHLISGNTFFRLYCFKPNYDKKKITYRVSHIEVCFLIWLWDKEIYKLDYIWR